MNHPFQHTIFVSLLTCVGPSRDLRNVNNAASVQLCAAFLILLQSAEKMEAHFITFTLFLRPHWAPRGFLCALQPRNRIYSPNWGYSRFFFFYPMVSWDLTFPGKGSGGVNLFPRLVAEEKNVPSWVCWSEEILERFLGVFLIVIIGLQEFFLHRNVLELQQWIQWGHRTVKQGFPTLSMSRGRRQKLLTTQTPFCNGFKALTQMWEVNLSTE